MPTHPHSATTNGHGNTTTTKIEKLLAYHEQAAAAIRLTMQLMNGHAKAAKTNGHASVLADAIALDDARVAKAATPSRKRKPTSRAHNRTAVLARRARTAAVLDAFNDKHPRSSPDVARDLGVPSRQLGIPVLLKHRYLKKRGDGYVRTAKAFAPNPYTTTDAQA